MDNKNLELKNIYISAVKNQQKGNSKIAENLYKKILKEIPNHISTQCNLGALYVQTGKNKKAMDLLQNVLQIEPNNINANTNLGIVFTRLIEYRKAINYYKKALQIDPNNADAYNNLGINYKQLGDTDLAKNCFYKAIKINVNHANAYNNLGTLFGALEEYEKALDALKKALEIRPNFFKAQANLSVTYINQQKHMEKAIIESHKALSMYHNLSKISNQRIPLYRLKHDVEQAEYLKSKNYKINGLNEFNKIGKEILSRKENKENESDYYKQVLLKDNEIKFLLPFFKADYIYNTSSISKGCLNPYKNWGKIEMEYFNNEKQIMYIDEFLSEEAIKEMREFCLTSKVWIHQHDNK